MLANYCGAMKPATLDTSSVGSQAISAAAEKPYDLILMDVQMPEVNGLAATRAVRRQVPADAQPVIFGLTAHATTEYRDMCFEAGMNGFLTKPLEPEKLRDLIAELSSKCSPRDFVSSPTKEPTG